MNRPAGKRSRPARLLIVDDHAVFREGLSTLLARDPSLELCGEAADAAGALELARGRSPDLALVDISLEGVGGLELTQTLRSRYPALRILILSMHKEGLYAERALRMGANGYIMKRESGRLLRQAIHRVLDGGTWVSPAVQDQLVQALRGGAASTPSVNRLSAREFEVYSLIGRGFSSRRIAEQLNISMKTVETHREHIREKLALREAADLAPHAVHWIHEHGGSLEKKT